MKSLIIIPSRLHSVRLPEKPLAMIEGKTLIQRVVEQALQCRNADGVIVATDHPKISDHILSLGYQAVLTSTQHPSGTDRVAEVAENLEADIIINVQGDEPIINPRQIEDLIDFFSNEEISIATQMNPIKNYEEVFDFNKVKVVTDIQHRALYFSRQAIPGFRDIPFREWPENTTYYKHIGIYGFRKKTLLEITQLQQGFLEKAESLEQLRWLENGFTIHCFPTSYESVGVDTPEDLEKVSAIVKMMF